MTDPGPATAVVTGAGHGIGRAVATALAAGGAAVVVNGRSPEPLAELVAEITAAGGRAVAVPGSAAREDVAAQLVAAADTLGEGVDALITCAGIPEPPGSSILTITPAQWQDLIDSHLTSTFMACRAVVPGMVARRRGCVVTTSSHAFTGQYAGTGYAAAKGAVNSLTYALAADLAEHGVRVNAVAPGARTRLSTGSQYEAGIADLHRRGLIDDVVRDASLAPPSPEHVAALYAFLAGPASAPLTGQVFAGSGGYLGRFLPPREKLLAWRDHHEHPPWTPAELAAHLLAAD